MLHKYEFYQTLLNDIMLNLTFNRYITHKEGETIDDCQDAMHENVMLGRFAIADGATRSFFPKIWADLLVNHFCDNSIFSFKEKNWIEWLQPIQQEWYEKAEEKVKDRNLFYLTNSFNTREPAAATFIGIEIDIKTEKWQAMIIGDSCLFHKTNSGFSSYLIEKSVDFDSFPEAFASYADKNYYPPTFISGAIHSDDILVLTTDAIAKWILDHNESGNVGTCLDRLCELDSNEKFCQFVNQARSEKVRLVNDDVTLMLISIEELNCDEKNKSRHDISSATHNSENINSSTNVLETIIWGLIAGVTGVWILRWVFYFIQDLLLTLFKTN